MKYIKKQESVSLVVLGSFKPIYIHAKWMYERGIINKGEWERHNNDLIMPNISRFTIDDVLEIVCDEKRLQIKSTDISLSNRIAKLGKDIIDIADIDNVNSLGINADIIFTFTNSDDAYNFGRYFVSLDAWTEVLNEPRVLSFSITEQIKPQEGEALRSISVHSVGEENNLPIVNMSINNHFNVSEKELLYNILVNTEDFHINFRDLYDKLINYI